MSTAAQSHRNPIAWYWTGQGRLWAIFWIWGVAISVVLAAVLALGIYRDVMWLKLVMLAVLAAYTPWIVVSVWRCAENVEDERLGIVARWLTVAWSLNAIFLLIALFFDIFVTPVTGGFY